MVEVVIFSCILLYKIIGSYFKIKVVVVKLTTFNHSTLVFEYKKSSEGKVYDKFWITREYKDILGCDYIGNIPYTALAIYTGRIIPMFLHETKINVFQCPLLISKFVSATCICLWALHGFKHLDAKIICTSLF